MACPHQWKLNGSRNSSSCLKIIPSKAMTTENGSLKSCSLGFRQVLCTPKLEAILVSVNVFQEGIFTTERFFFSGWTILRPQCPENTLHFLPCKDYPKLGALSDVTDTIALSIWCNLMQPSLLFLSSNPTPRGTMTPSLPVPSRSGKPPIPPLAPFPFPLSCFIWNRELSWDVTLPSVFFSGTLKPDYEFLRAARKGAGNMAQWLKSFVALGPEFSFRTHMVVMIVVVFYLDFNK